MKNSSSDILLNIWFCVQKILVNVNFCVNYPFKNVLFTNLSSLSLISSDLRITVISQTPGAPLQTHRVVTQLLSAFSV